MLGLREYQLKKSRSENRLKESKINLEKTKALTEEILPHLRSLKRQTSRWEKRMVLQEELKELENVFFGSQSQELEEKISIILHEIQAHKREHSVLEKEKELAEEAEKKLGEGAPRDREVIIKLKKETQELLEKKSLLHKELGRLEAELEFGKTISTPTLPTKHLIEFLKKIKSRLQEGVQMDFVELGYTIKDVIEEIDEFLAGGAPAKQGAGPSMKAESEMSPDIRLKFSTLEKQLKDIDSKIIEIRKEEESLEKNQEKFYADFKSATSAFRQVMEKIEEWEGENQKRLFEKERLELRLEELARQITQAGRGKKEFENFRITEERKSELTDLAGVEKHIFKLRGDLASIGEIDKDGYLRITDRKKELLITAGGENVAPQAVEGQLKSIPVVAQAVALGDRQKFIAALVTLDPDQVPPFAAAAGSEAKTPLDASKCEKFKSHLEKQIEIANEKLARVQRVRKFAILPNELTIDGGELTPTMKLKRRVISDKYKEQIAQLFAD